MGDLGRMRLEFNGARRTIIDALRLYLVTDPELCAANGVVKTVRDAIRGGVTSVQLRDKEATTSALVATGRALIDILAGTGVPLIINDDVEAAKAIGADGVHVGQGDMNVEDVRRMVGPRTMIGLSCGSIADAKAADPKVVDYIGVSPLFTTPTKTDHSGAVGLAGLYDIAAATPIPKVAIGGIKMQHFDAVFAAGADGVAVVSAICGQGDVEQAARLLSKETVRVIVARQGQASACIKAMRTLS